MDNSLDMSVIGTEDSALWRRIVDGDIDALGVLYDRYYPSLLNYGLKFIADREFVKDAVHDLFVRVGGNRSLKKDVVVSSYLFRSLKNILLNQIQRKRPGQLEAFAFNLPDDDNIFDTLFKSDDKDRELAIALKSALAQLSENQKQALYLRYVGGFSHREIAAMLDMNEQSSMNLVHRAFSKLRKLMGDEKFFLIVCLFLRTF